MNLFWNKLEGLSLRELTDKMQLNYYDLLQTANAKASEKLSLLKAGDVHQVTLGYTEACEKILSYISQTLQDRKIKILPYTDVLHEKEVTGHNCHACSGSCDMGHQMNFMVLRTSHLDLMTLLYNLQAAVLPLYSNLDYPVAYDSLRKEMLPLELLLRQMLFAEEAYLMKAILRSQKSIHVHN